MTGVHPTQLNWRGFTLKEVWAVALLLLFSGSALCTLCAALLLLLQQRANAKERTPHTLKWSWGYEVAWAHWKWNFVLNNASGSSSKSEIQNLRKVSWSWVRWFNACSNGELLWAHQSIQNPKDLRNIKSNHRPLWWAKTNNLPNLLITYILENQRIRIAGIATEMDHFPL